MGASLSEFAEMLDSMDSVSDIFPAQPSMLHIHIIVRMTEPSKRQRMEMLQTPVSSHIAPHLNKTPPCGPCLSRELTSAMEGALEPFATNLAEGTLEGRLALWYPG